MSPDMFEPKKRSEIMSHIHSKNTKGEMFVRKYFAPVGFPVSFA